MKIIFYEKQKLKYYEEKMLYQEMVLYCDFIIYYSILNIYFFGIYDCVCECLLLR